MYFRKKGEKWYYTIYVEDVYGKRRKIERVGGRTRAEAKKKAKEALKEANEKILTSGPKERTFADYIDFWLSNYAEVNLTQFTQANYTMILNKVAEALGEHPLSKITSSMLQDYLNQMKRDGYACTSISTYRAVITKVINDAVYTYRYLDRNPASNLHTPRSDDEKKHIKVFTPKEMKVILDYFHHGKDLYVPIRLGYHLGLRAGECLALSWEDIDFDTNMVCVCKTMYYNGSYTDVMHRTKGKRARTIVMDDTIMKVLRQQKLDQKKNRKKYGSRYIESDLVCTHEDGRPLCYYQICTFNKFCKRKNIAGTFHCLRHTHATMLIEAGLDLDYVSKRLGHSNIRTTSDVYLHTTKKRDKNAKEIMDHMYQQP